MKTLYINEHNLPHSKYPNRYVQFKMFTVLKDQMIEQTLSTEIKLAFIKKGKLLVSWSHEGESRTGVASEGEMVFTPLYVEGKAWALADTTLIVLTCNMPHPEYYQRTMDYLHDCKNEVDDPQACLYTLPITENVNRYLDQLEVYLKAKSEGRENFMTEIHEIKEEELFPLMQMEYSKLELYLFFSRGLSHNLQFFSVVLSNYKRCRTIKDLAEKCGYELTRFNHLFKQYFSEAPYKWLTEQTNRHLYKDLKESKLSIKEIVNKYNFSSPSHFTTYCRRNFGTTPTDIRSRDDSPELPT